MRSQWENNGAKIYSEEDYATLKVIMTDNENARDNISVCLWQIFDSPRLLRWHKYNEIARILSFPRQNDLLFTFLQLNAWPWKYFWSGPSQRIFILSFQDMSTLKCLIKFRRKLSLEIGSDLFPKFSYRISSRVDISPQLIKYLIAKVYNHHPSHLHPILSPSRTVERSLLLLIDLIKL